MKHLKYHLLQRFQPTSKVVNTRAKIKKTQNTINMWLSEAAMADSNHLATESGALIGSTDDLLIELLLRLPVTSVLRFRSVSKHWRWLLSHRRFTLLYKNASISPGFFVRNLYMPFDDENRIRPPFRDLDFYTDPNGIRIVQSCNGLLLCCSHRGDARVCRYYVFNPTTKQFAVVPSVLGGMAVRKSIYFMGLAFHQTDCVHYKVVCFHRATRDDVFKIQIYSSDTGKWKISDESFSLSAPYYASFYYIVYWTQAIHWAPCCVDPLHFKLDTEELKSLPLPVPVASSEGYENGDMPIYFGESKGHLHLVEAADRSSESHLHLNVYDMFRDHSGWFLKYRVELDELVDGYPNMINSNLDPSSRCYYELEVFDVVRGEEDDETFMVIRIPGKVIRYNVAEKSFKQISDQIYLYGRTNAHRYIESLLSF